MKRIALLFLYFVSVHETHAQDSILAGVIYRDSVPLFVQADLFSISPTPKNSFRVLSAKVKISLATAQHYLIADNIINIINLKDKSLTPFAISQLQYRITSNHTSNVPWMAIGNVKYLVDTVLNFGNPIVIQFRHAQQQRVFQAVVFTRVDIQPSIIAFRAKAASDTVNDKAASRQYFEYGTMPKNFTFFESGPIIVGAGNDLEIAIKSHSLYRDSVIEFNIADSYAIKTPGWRLAGHFIRIDRLESKHKYVLSFRYKGQKEIHQYQLDVLPYWWQEPWAICLFIGSGLIIITGAWYLGLRSRRKQQQREINLWVERTKTGHHKLDTHWVDNMFHTSLGFIRDNQNALADEYLTKASSILREKLVHGDKPLIPLINDIKILRDFIDNESIKSSFLYSIEVDPILDIENIEVPPFLWQPSLENAIKHGVTDKTGRIIVKVITSDSDLVYSIQDTGIFRHNTASKQGGHGMIITQERVNGFNRANLDSFIKYEVSFSDSGTFVWFIFKNWLL